MKKAQDFLGEKISDKNNDRLTELDIVTLMEKYGEYCVDKILKLASENAVVSINGLIQEYDENCCVDKNSILNTRLLPPPKIKQHIGRLLREEKLPKLLIDFSSQPNIEFIESHNFFGEQFSLKVGDKTHILINYRNPQIDDYIRQAVKILLEIYGITYKLEDVKLVWDNTL